MWLTFSENATIHELLGRSCRGITSSGETKLSYLALESRTRDSPQLVPSDYDSCPEVHAMHVADRLSKNSSVHADALVHALCTYVLWRCALLYLLWRTDVTDERKPRYIVRKSHNVHEAKTEIESSRRSRV